MQMQEKTMVADTLTGINGELVRFGEMIPQTENKELKQTLKQFRNACEQSQEELYQIAREKSYYVPAAKATQAEIDHVKSLFTEKTIYGQSALPETAYAKIGTAKRQYLQKNVKVPGTRCQRQAR